MWQRPIRFLMLALVGLAFLGGATVQALPPGGMPAAAAGAGFMPGCTDAAMAQDEGAPAPHKGITPDCVKVTKCLGIPSLPVRTGPASAPVTYAAAAYWTVNPLPGGLSPPPAPFPPRPA